ncbi:SCP2 sterol-binding domain-containing protein [Leptospira weilii]|uniref:SCP2 sterol-binding domain-containing protein n=1 Tax=Leptospira weilii TaxID=28184 RepID=UPI000248630F|nr:SCP2 sterol-binding domain-containing protein [Leptospira weilii]MCL8268332.1 SCP2 sterol-binding domain-containing protein [Leptospira weilii]
MEADNMINSTILECLTLFQEKVNENPRMKTLLKNWNPIILVESNDLNDKYFLTIRDTKIVDIQNNYSEDINHLIHLRANSENIVSVFSGKLNPANAFLNGTLEVFAQEKDQIKLDAISLVLWGI